MPSANYTTSVPVAQTAGEVQAMLAKAGAKRIMTEFVSGSGGASIASMSFQIETEIGVRGFTLPIRSEGVLATLKRDGVKPQYLTLEHAENVAWRIAATWLKGQLALIDAGMTTLDEIMFPWMLMGPEEKPAYETFTDTQKAITA